MKKTSRSILISGGVFLGIFNLLFFVIGEMPHPTSVWISYAAIHIALLLALILPLVTSGRKTFAILSNVSYLFTGIYFVLAFIVALIFIFVAPESDGGIKASWVIQLVLLGLFVISFVAIFYANAHTNEELERQGQEARFIQNLSSKVKFLRDCVDDNATIRQLDVLYNILAASPIKTSYEVQSIESQLGSELSDLEEAVEKKKYAAVQEIATRMARLTQERNRVLQLASH